MEMMKSLRTLLITNIIALAIAFFWNKLPYIKDTAHLILDPSVGVLLNWNVSLGVVIITFIISLIISLLQKYTTDQALLREIRKEQKFLSDEMRKYKEHPEKFMELQKRNMEIFWKSFEITLRPALYTAIPIILFFRWFNDYFIANPVKIFGFMGWIWAYLVLSIIFSIIFRKLFKLA